MKFKRSNRSRGIVNPIPHQTGTIPSSMAEPANTRVIAVATVGEDSYRDRFLVNDGVRSRVSTYVNRDTHEKIKRLLSNAAPDISVVSYLNNILVHHMEMFEDEIAQLYRSGVDKPF